MLIPYLHEFSRIDEVVLQHLLSETTHRAVKLICCLTVLDPPGQTDRGRKTSSIYKIGRWRQEERKRQKIRK